MVAGGDGDYVCPTSQRRYQHRFEIFQWQRRNQSAGIHDADSGLAEVDAGSKVPGIRGVSRETKSDLFYQERKPDGSLGEPVAFLQTPFNEAAPSLSPDSRWIAYSSDESGRSEVFVSGFPKRDATWRVSVNGGIAPLWSKDGRELFYVEGDKLMAVGVTGHPGFSAGTPVMLFERNTLQSGDPQYDVAPDGKRFLLRENSPKSLWRFMWSTIGSRNFAACRASKRTHHNA